MPVHPVFAPAVAVAARRRRIIRKFQEAGADVHERARTFAELDVREGLLTSRMIRSGVLAAAGGGRYHLSAEGLERWRRRRNVYLLSTLGGVVVLTALLFLVLRNR